MASEHWGRHSGTSDSTSTHADSGQTMAQNQKVSHDQNLVNLVKKQLGKAPSVKEETAETADIAALGDIDIHYRYHRLLEEDGWVATVYVGVLGKDVEGHPQPRKKPAKQSAAQEACELIAQKSASTAVNSGKPSRTTAIKS